MDPELNSPGRRRSALAAALQAARRDLALADIAEACEVALEDVVAWERGQLQPDLETILRLEQTVGLDAGVVLNAAGYVGGARETEDGVTRTLFFDNLEDLVAALEATEILGFFHVQAESDVVQTVDDDGYSYEVWAWRLELQEHTAGALN